MTAQRRARIPTPDSGRLRRDNGISHKTSGVWHATTLTNIGRDSIDAGLTSYGRRSMGDQLRFSKSGPRELEDHDFCADEKTPKVIQNPRQEIISGPAHFNAPVSTEEQAELDAILDKRAGTQRGKTRSRQPQENPLGGRIFDMTCCWPMYRTPYNGSFRYVCGFYQQSHGACCHHNHVDGPLMVEFLWTCARQRLFLPNRLQKLEAKLREIAAREAVPSNNDNELCRVRNEIQAVEGKLQTVSRNMALAETAEIHKSMAAVFQELQQEKRNLQATITSLEARSDARVDASSEVAAAMKVVKNLGELANEPSHLASAGEFFRKLNVRLFLRFKEGSFGKRTVRKQAGGIVTFGMALPPIEIYQGPTARRQLRHADILGTSGSAELALEASETNGPGREGDSLGNVNRGDRI